MASTLIVASAAPATAQNGRDEHGFQHHTIDIPRGQESVQLRVLLPPEHDSSTTGLPVLYYLDAWWWGEMFEGTMRMAATAHPSRIAPVILVGISNVGDADSWNRTRNRDFTPSPYRPIAPGVTMRTGNVVLDSSGTGGAAAFLAFLETLVIPAIEGRYKVADAGHGLVGHSYGGLFATWVLANRPNLFDRFLIVSPSTYWNDSAVLGMGVFNDRSTPRALKVFLATGSDEMRIMTRSGDALEKALATLRDTQVEVRRYDGADHLTVLPPALLDGLISLYGR